MSMASIETMGTTKDVPERKLVNLNLISLKCLLFLFFGGEYVNQSQSYDK